MTSAIVEREEVAGTEVLRLSHGKANALDLDSLRALTAALAASTRGAVILTGTGRIFSAGLDLNRLIEGGRSYVRELVPALSECLVGLFAHPRPVVAAVNGHAIAGGGLLAWASDFRVMADGPGRIGVPELRVGVPFPWIALEIVRFALAPPQANEVIFRGGTYAPAEALSRGLVDEVVEERRLLDRAREVAAHLASTPPSTFAETKAMTRAPVLEGWRRHGAESDRRTAELWSSDEIQSAVRGYVERTLKK